MRHDVNSMNTKCALTKSLKKLAEQGKPLEKITIGDIVRDCGVNRNTFYYHFSDINELILWSIHSDLYQPIVALEESTGDQIRDYIVNYFHNNRKFLDFAYACVGFDTLQDGFFKELYPIVNNYIELMAHSLKIQITPSYQQFLSELYAMQVSSLYLIHFRRPEQYSRELCVKYLKVIFDYSIPSMLTHEKDVEP